MCFIYLFCRAAFHFPDEYVMAFPPVFHADPVVASGDHHDDSGQTALFSRSRRLHELEAEFDTRNVQLLQEQVKKA
jgi:hypothetical protein